jgi:FAD/FMN-containing dehydrogenase
VPELAAGVGAIPALAADLRAVLGDAGVSADPSARRAASTDFAFLSPVLAATLPDRPADLVAYPRTTAELAAAVSAATRRGVPVTPRGRGTGNYGQAVPLSGGVVVDLTRCDRVREISDGWARVDAGATFVAIEAAARTSGQELAMAPTTTGSTIGGFLGGGAGGVGSIQHGFIWDGFVSELTVVDAAGQVSTVAGAECGPYLHAYGVSGIIAAATVRLAPARSWVAVLASFAGEVDAVAAGLAMLALEPAPRLVSLDEPGLVATYPADVAMPGGRYSLRLVVEAPAVPAVRAALTVHGGRVEAVRPDGAAYVTSLAFNHVTLRARRTRPELCHLQVGGDALVTRAGEVRATLPGAMLHLDGVGPGGHRAFGGLLLSMYRGTDVLYAGVERLRALGVQVIDPHTWLLGGPALPAIRAAARRNDPSGLLNPGKLPA